MPWAKIAFVADHEIENLEDYVLTLAQVAGKFGDPRRVFYSPPKKPWIRIQNWFPEIHISDGFGHWLPSSIPGKMSSLYSTKYSAVTREFSDSPSGKRCQCTPRNLSEYKTEYENMKKIANQHHEYGKQLNAFFKNEIPKLFD